MERKEIALPQAKNSGNETALTNSEVIKKILLKNGAEKLEEVLCFLPTDYQKALIGMELDEPSLFFDGQELLDTIKEQAENESKAGIELNDLQRDFRHFLAQDAARRALTWELIWFSENGVDSPFKAEGYDSFKVEFGVEDADFEALVNRYFK